MCFHIRLLPAPIYTVTHWCDSVNHKTPRCLYLVCLSVSGLLDCTLCVSEIYIFRLCLCESWAFELVCLRKPINLQSIVLKRDFRSTMCDIIWFSQASICTVNYWCDTVNRRATLMLFTTTQDSPIYTVWTYASKPSWSTSCTPPSVSIADTSRSPQKTPAYLELAHRQPLPATLVLRRFGIILSAQLCTWAQWPSPTRFSVLSLRAPSSSSSIDTKHHKRCSLSQSLWGTQQWKTIHTLESGYVLTYVRVRTVHKNVSPFMYSK